MQSFERLNEAIYKLGKCLVECASALKECLINSYFTNLTNIVAEVAAYNVAEKEHPDWVHRAKYSKKKRIRKKYHDRIIRQYWRADNDR